MFIVKMHRFSLYQVCLPTLIVVSTLKMFLNASTSFIFEIIQSCAKNVACRLSRVSNWPRVAYFVLVMLISNGK